MTEIAALAARKDEWAALPDDATLRASLETVLDVRGAGVTLVERIPSIDASTFPAEVAVCRTGSGDKVQLYCKYGRGGSLEYGHRRGVAYEAAVYRDVLEPLGVSTPRFHGSFADPESGEVCLVLDYVDDCLPLGSTPDPDTAMRLATGWLADFHETAAIADDSGTLTRYDAAYYLGWAERATRLAERLGLDLPWLPAVIRRYDELVAALLADPPTVVHGEFYPANVLLRDGSLCVVDWESAAIASGSIDVASLAHEWPDEVVTACHADYVRARFGPAPPAGWGDALAAARLYWEFRWLGDDPSPPERVARREFDQLCALGEELGL